MPVTDSPPIYIGLPQWHHPHWSQIGLKDLADYSQWFNCVEGNTTFYALPKAEVVRRWRDMTHDDFRFCFKFPSVISHQAALTECSAELRTFWQTLMPLHDRIGQLWLQLPAQFSPTALPRLWHFLEHLPNEFHYGVEVRHPDFFAKGEAERALNQGLMARGISRVMLDSRPLHHARPDSAALRDAQQKKPRLPVHALATGSHPLIRFIGAESREENTRWFGAWYPKLQQWQQEQRCPYLFIHTPDNREAPQLALHLWQLLSQKMSQLPAPHRLPEQNSLF